MFICVSSFYFFAMGVASRIEPLVCGGAFFIYLLYFMNGDDAVGSDTCCSMVMYFRLSMLFEVS